MSYNKGEAIKSFENIVNSFAAQNYGHANRTEIEALLSRTRNLVELVCGVDNSYFQRLRTAQFIYPRAKAKNALQYFERDKHLVLEILNRILDELKLTSAAVDLTPNVSNNPVVSVSTDDFDIERLLERQIKGLPRAMIPLKVRREGLPRLEFDNEYDVQSLFHALLKPWITDIRPEQYTPSYAGSSTRVDFLLVEYGIVCELKFARDNRHGSKIGDELILDIAHYKVMPSVKQLWIAIYDPHSFIHNPGGLIADLEKNSERLRVRAFVLGTG